VCVAVITHVNGPLTSYHITMLISEALVQKSKNTSAAALKQTGSQCSDCNTGVMCSDHVYKLQFFAFIFADLLL